MGSLLEKFNLSTFDMKIILVIAILSTVGTLTNGCCKVNCCKKAVCGGHGRAASLNFKANLNGDAVESLAFQYCNTDSIEGLSWPEVEECEDNFCGNLPIHCPTRSEFDEFDEDNNGILTWDEWKSKSG